MNAICVFELQKMHIYFPNGSDFHINLSFKVKYYFIFCHSFVSHIQFLLDKKLLEIKRWYFNRKST